MRNVPALPKMLVALLFGWAVLPCAGLLAGEPAQQPAAEPPPVDKSSYNLFHPVPESELRDFNPDRPTLADGPYTIDAGHVQVEMDFVNYVLDSHNPERAPVRIDQWNPAPVVVRIGIVDRAEFDVQYDGYLNVRTRDRTSGRLQTSVMSGFGDLTLLTKINLFGNETGTTALAIFPSLKIPTNTAGLGNDAVEGNFALPFNAKLPADFQLGVETEVGFVRNSADTHYIAEFTNVVVLSHPLVFKALQGYVEFFSVVDAEHGTPVTGQVDVGLIYQIGNNMEIDAGCNIGVTRAASDYQPFTGFAIRF